MKFAFYGRVSTEDQQDPTSSKQWQMARAESILPAGAEIVAEFFDIGQCAFTTLEAPTARAQRSSTRSSIPTEASTQSSSASLRVPSTATSSVTPSRCSRTTASSCGCPRWAERSTPVRDAHDLLMQLYGGMSKGERNRIKIRVAHGDGGAGASTRAGSSAVARPTATSWPTPGHTRTRRKAADGQRLRQLEADSDCRAYRRDESSSEYIGGAGSVPSPRASPDRIPSPSGHDPARNRNRASANGAWGKSAVRAILQNPKYTGSQCGTASGATRPCWTSTTSPQATRAACAGTTAANGCGPPSRRMSRSSFPKPSPLQQRRERPDTTAGL